MNNTQGNGSTAVPPSRQRHGIFGRLEDGSHALGDLLVQDRPDGTRGIRFPNSRCRKTSRRGQVDKRASRSRRISASAGQLRQRARRDRQGDAAGGTGI
jgi:hypothetical protein